MNCVFYFHCISFITINMASSPSGANTMFELILQGSEPYDPSYPEKDSFAGESAELTKNLFREFLQGGDPLRSLLDPSVTDKETAYKLYNLACDTRGLWNTRGLEVAVKLNELWPGAGDIYSSVMGAR